MYSVSEIPSKRSSDSQKVLCQEAQPVCEPLPPSAPNIDSKSVVWMCAVTGQWREVAWFQVRVALSLRETRPCGLVRLTII